jgi:asparagine synthase (glutamine-hydrolysing)
MAVKAGDATFRQEVVPEIMCGIAGFVTRSGGSPHARAILERMTDSIRYRGPDDSGAYVNGPACLGHRRLSIVDLSPLGHQPMSNETRDVWIVFNGEVFNHADLRPDLERAGHRYQSRSDTETIVHAYEQYGSGCVTRLRGMFAFAIWSERTQTLFCARDRLGIKPFYYFWDGSLFAFASEIKALLEHPAISASFNEDCLAEYLAFGYVSSEETMFRNIRKLMPGNTLTLRLSDGAGAPEIRSYWDVERSTEEEKSPDAWIAECRQRLEEAVRTRLMADVPLGVFLSGGVDSSAIAALVKRMTSAPVKTFSVGYAEAPYSELGYARETAQAIGTEHREVVIGMEDFFNALPNLVWHEDEPITWPSSVPLYFVAKLASEDVKVVLTGEGSDELFAGYERYRRYLWNRKALAWYRMVPSGIRNRIRRSLAESDVHSASLRRKLLHTFLGRDESVESLHVDNFYSAFGEDEQRRLLRRPPRTGSAYVNFLEYWNRGASGGPLWQMLYTDQKTYLGELLMKQDQMSMANSIESRVPFLDHHFVEFAARVPDSMKLHGATTKYILKKAVEDLIPREIIYRRKMGFPTPLRDWLKDARADRLFDLLRSPDGLIAEYVDRGALERLIARHRGGLEDATDRLWRLLNLQLWGDRFLSSKPAPESLLPDPTLERTSA